MTIVCSLETSVSVWTGVSVKHGAMVALSPTPGSSHLSNAAFTGVAMPLAMMVLGLLLVVMAMPSAMMVLGLLLVVAVITNNLPSI